MAYSATARRLLISCPGDVPPRDLQVVHQAINRWNGIYGHSFASVVVPISWGTHAASEFGRSPQEVINSQLVDYCDICIAMFACRLGTPTAVAESGTVEEITRLHQAGRYVGVLRSRRHMDPASFDPEQARRLAEYLDSIRETALVLEYTDDIELSHHVDAIIASAIAADRARADVQLSSTSPAPPESTPHQHAQPATVAELFARVESTITSQSHRRFGDSQRRWALILTNTGKGTARNVKFAIESFDEGQPHNWEILSDGTDEYWTIETLPPGQSISFNLVLTLASAAKARCVMTWDDDRGPSTSSATLRLS